MSFGHNSTHCIIIVWIQQNASRSSSQNISPKLTSPEPTVNSETDIRRPVLSRHARYRWDALRQQHLVVFPEGVLVLNESGAAILQHCDGRSVEDLVAALRVEYADADPANDVRLFLTRLFEKGLVCNASETRSNEQVVIKDTPIG